MRVMTVVRWVHLVALIVWIGAVVFFSFVVAPAIFRTFPPPAVEAGRVIGAIFPVYYRIGYVCGVVLLLTALALLAAAPARAWFAVESVVLAGMLAATLYAGTIILPRATELRPQIHDPAAPASAKAEFDRLHHLAVVLNGAVLVGGVVSSVITAAAPRP
jgi:uncharacterized membrane protein